MKHSKFTGTSWQRGNANETTNWQQGNVLNASGRSADFRPPIQPMPRASAANNWLAAIPRTARRTDERLLPPMMDRSRGDDPTRWYFARKKKGTGFRRFDGNMMMKKDTSTMSVGAFVMSMVSVGVLFFVIGYGYSKGRKSA